MKPEIFSSASMPSFTDTISKEDLEFFNKNPTEPRSVWKYQLVCPNCNTVNWGELEETIFCKCGKSIRATSKKIDYLIPVDDGD